jgi:hypothetical protein
MIGLWTRTSHENERATDRTPDRRQPTLHYAPVERHARRRVWFKGIALSVFFIAASLLCAAIVRRAVVSWKMIRLERQVAVDAVPADRIWAPDQVGSPIIFRHRRVRPDGVERLIWVEVPRFEPKSAAIVCSVFPFHRFWDTSHQGSLVSSRSFNVDKLFGGQPDPNDESHFTIAYESNGEKGTIDGWLMNDDTVKLEVRDGPLRDK